MTLRLRCSALPLAFRCPGSVHDAGLRVDEHNDASGLGTAVHAVLARLVETGAVPWDDVDSIAADNDADPEDVRPLVGAAAKLWRDHLSPMFPDAVAECAWHVDLDESGEVALTGHADAYADVTRTHARILDWKTGRVDGEYRDQMLGYCALTMLSTPALDLVEAVVVWVREGEVERYSMDRPGLAAWLGRLRSEVVNWSGTFCPGPHCYHCPRQHDCPAATALVRRDVGALLDLDEPLDVAALSPEQIILLHGVAGLVAGTAERVRAAIKAHVKAHGPVSYDGDVLALVEEPRREVDPVKAWAIVERTCATEAEWADVVKVSAKAIEDVAASHAEKRGGAAARRAVKAELEAAGAVTNTTVTKLVKRRTEKP